MALRPTRRCSVTIGAPCWFELATPDPDLAKAFYGKLFGWSAVRDDSGYSTFLLEGQSVAAVHAVPPGAAAAWSIYFSVEDVDRSVASAEALGGRVVQAPVAMGEYGRMAIVTDPQGARFSLWQALSREGVDVMQSFNSVLWVELATRNIAKAAEFYSALLGWTTKAHAGAPEVYQIFSAGEKDWGGLLEMDADWGEVPPFWSFYVWSADVDTNVEQAKEMGSRIFAPPFDAPAVGRLAMLSDPTGARFALITPTPPES